MGCLEDGVSGQARLQRGSPQGGISVQSLMRRRLWVDHCRYRRRSPSDEQPGQDEARRRGGASLPKSDWWSYGERLTAILNTDNDDAHMSIDHRLENFTVDGAYRVLEVIGEGAYGIVWSVHATLARLRAIDPDFDVVRIRLALPSTSRLRERLP